MKIGEFRPFMGAAKHSNFPGNPVFILFFEFRKNTDEHRPIGGHINFSVL